MSQSSSDNVIRAIFAIVTAAAAVLGVNLSPASNAAKPQDVAEVVRSELAPLTQKVDHLSSVQLEQGQRLQKVEAVVLSADATSTH